MFGGEGGQEGGNRVQLTEEDIEEANVVNSPRGLAILFTIALAGSAIAGGISTCLDGEKETYYIGKNTKASVTNIVSDKK